VATAMDADSVLVSFLKSHSWEVSELLVDLYEDPNDDSPNSIDLTQWMINTGSRRLASRENVRMQLENLGNITFLHFSCKLRNIQAIMLLTISIATCAINQLYPTSQSQEKFLYFKAGLSPNNIVLLLNNNSCHDFMMCNDGYGGNKNSRSLICRRGHLAKRSVGSVKMSATQLPTSADEKCTFYLTINWDVDLDRWYVRQYNSHCWAHWGHPRLPHELQYDTIQQVPEETLETAKEL
jgi:hypothetical protein